MDWFDWCWFPMWLAVAIAIGAVVSWALSALTYEHVRHDIESWAQELRQAHIRQLAHDRAERKAEHDYILYLLDRLIARLQAGQGRNGKGDPPCTTC